MERNAEAQMYSQFDPNLDQDMYRDPLFNPMMQYEQAYMYYRYLTQQLDYKIRCKEYEKLTRNDSRRE